MADNKAVNHWVGGSNPSRGAIQTRSKYVVSSSILSLDNILKNGKI